MIKVTPAIVIQEPRQIKGKYGYCTIVKVRLMSSDEEIAIFSKENDSNVLKRYIDEKVEIYKDAKGKYRLVDKDTARNVNGDGLHHISSSLPSTPNGNGNSNQTDRDIIDDIPMLSDSDKKKVAKFIQQQSKLLKYTVDVVKADFPELVGTDDRAIRSMAISLLINTNMVINRNL